MGFIEQNLMSGEQVVYLTKRHWILFILPVIWLILLSLSIIGSLGSGVRLNEFFMFLIFLLPMAILPLVWAYIDRKTSEFAVTNKRVLIKVGFIRRKTFENLLNKVEGIQVDQDICGRIFGFGTIIVKGTGGTNNPFRIVAAPFEFRKKVQEQIEKMHSGADKTQQARESMPGTSGKFCSSCGTKNESIAKFCSSCGSQV